MEEKFDKATVNQIFPFFIHTIKQSLLPFFQYKIFFILFFLYAISKNLREKITPPKIPHFSEHAPVCVDFQNCDDDI